MAHRPERLRTDKSLRAERDKTDRELALRRAAAMEDADQVLGDARRAADAVLRLARKRADALIDRHGSSERSRRQVKQERARYDRKVSAARAKADATLSSERRDRRHEIADLLEAERRDTDARLTFERGRSDQDIASRDEFLAMASHDLRGFVAAISLSAGSLLRLEVAQEVTQAADVIRRAAGHMGALIADLMDLVSIEAGRLTVRPERHAVAPLVEELASTFGPLASEKGISLSTSVASDVRAARFDRRRIVQVLSNLVANSIKFTTRGGHIAIGAKRASGGVQLWVTDDGCGIPLQRQATIFERFKQHAPSDRTGLGLGLYIARVIVEAHGGSISVESAEGAGSTFRFTIPGAKPLPHSRRSSRHPR